MFHIFDHPAVTFVCRRCGKEIPNGHQEACWRCGGPLCYECWDEHGECSNHRLTQPKTDEQTVEKHL
jgi:ribosomal protein L37E